MPRAKTVVVRLTADRPDALDRPLRTGSHPAAMRPRAAILLRADADGPDAWTDDEIAEHLDTTRITVQRVPQPLAADGSDVTPHRKTPTGRPYRERDGEPEAGRVARAGSKAPDGPPRWAMTSLAERLVGREVVGTIDPSTVGRAPQKTTSSRGSGSRGSSRRRAAGRSSRRWGA